MIHHRWVSLPPPNIQSACSLCSRLIGATAAAGEMHHGEAAGRQAGEASPTGRIQHFNQVLTSHVTHKEGKT